MKEIGLVLSDIDGCLGGKTFDLTPLAKIRDYCEAVRMGSELPPLAFATGRGAEYVDCLVRVINAYMPQNLPSIVENGAFLYYPAGRILVPHPAMEGNEETILKVRSILKKHIVEVGKGRFVPGKEACVSLIPGNNIPTDEFKTVVQGYLTDSLLERLFITYSTTAVDITIAGVNKGSSLGILCEKTGINTKNILAIGDAKGDLEILERVGFPACPGNASEEVKHLVREKGGYVAQAKIAWGVAEIMQHYELIRKE